MDLLHVQHVTDIASYSTRPNYCIAGKFQGRKFLRLTSLKTVRELNFKDQPDYHCICIL